MVFFAIHKQINFSYAHLLKDLGAETTSPREFSGPVGEKSQVGCDIGSFRPINDQRI